MSLGLGMHGARRRALVYARVSSKEQEKEGFSIPAQLGLLRDYATRQNLAIAQEYVDIETAKQAGRTAFTEMVNFLRRQQQSRNGTERCRTILVEKTDRLLRNLKDWVTLDDLDVEIHLVKDGTVLSDESRSSEKLMHGIKVLMAKNYIDNLSEEVKKGLAEKVRQGLYPGKRPLGYRHVERNGKRVIEVEPNLASGIAKLFELYVTGRYSLQDLAERSDEFGLKYNETGNPIRKTTVQKILTNPIYHGEFRWKGAIHQGSHEPIISRELFEQVQIQLALNGSTKTTKEKRTWAFQGLMKCGHCGHAMIAEIKKGKYIYYHCANYLRGCKSDWIKEGEAARQFGEILQAARIPDVLVPAIVRILRDGHADKKRHHEEAVKALQSRHRHLQARLDAMYEDKLDGAITAEYFERKAQEWRREQSTLTRKIEQHQGADTDYADFGVRLIRLAQQAGELYQSQNNTEKRRLIEIVLSNSTYKDGIISPVYRKPFDIIAIRNEEARKEKAVSDSTYGLSPRWLGNRDSNPD
ncbi:recombinase family protein [bacterium]|nr:recombinase family protein [bacterium]